ncbi:MAG: FitA-like ribbon-helix-helix domain-containing protein [Coriobacteriia bacterium]
MPDLLIRNVPENTMQRLKAQAERNDRSVQKEALAVIEAGTQLTMAEWLERAAQLREELRAAGYLGDSTADIREDRDSR